MFNIFSTPTRTESGNLYPSWSWSTVIKDAEGKDVSVADLISKYNEAMKEIKNLNHLKEENVQLIERINEIDSDMNKEYQAEIFTLKNDIGVLKAKYQILDHNYQGCTKHRDEYKHQLKAADIEIEELKKWKKGQLTIENWWSKVDKYVRDHDDAPLGGFVANTCLNFLKERDELKAEVKKLKEDIIDYVFEKDDEIEKLKAQKHPMYPLHWGILQNAMNLTEDVKVDLDKSLDEQCDEVKKSQNWSTTKVAIQDAIQAKWRGIYGIEIDSINIEEPFVESELEKRVKKLERKVEEFTSIKTCQK